MTFRRAWQDAAPVQVHAYAIMPLLTFTRAGRAPKYFQVHASPRSTCRRTSSYALLSRRNASGSASEPGLVSGWHARARER